MNNIKIIDLSQIDWEGSRIQSVGPSGRSAHLTFFVVKLGQSPGCGRFEIS